MASNAFDVNQLDSDLLLPPRKRLLAGYKKQQNSKFINGGDPSFASSSSTTTSNGSSASTDVQSHLDNLMKSQLNDQIQSPEELLQSAKETAALAANAAEAARAKANEKAMIASKAVAAAKNALELFASKEKSPKKKKHVPVQLGVADDEDYLARRLNLAINNSPRVFKDGSIHRNNKEKSSVTSTMYDGVDVAGVVDSDSSVDEEVNPVKEKTVEESTTFGRKRLRVKLKLLPLSMCASSKDQENNVGVSQLEGSDGRSRS